MPRIERCGQCECVASIRLEAPALIQVQHGYLPRNGMATVQQFIDGTYNVYGMERDLGGFLAIYGALIDGDVSLDALVSPRLLC